MNIWVGNVWADINSDSHGNPYSFAIMLVVFFVIFYFMIFRPQQKRNRSHKELLQSISKGDEIVTSGGLVGRVVKVTEMYIFVVLNDKYSNNEIIVRRDCIASVLPKGTIKTL